MDASENSLLASLTRYEIQLPTDQCAEIDSYCQYLWEWNRRLNLTRHTDYDRFVARDVLDCVRLAAVLEPDEEILDVGSGGGVPGVLLAILRPDVQVSVSESVEKRARALDDIVSHLGLPIPVYHDRAENVLEDLRFSSLTARGVGSLSKLLRWVEPHWISIGRLLLIKGPRWVQERGEARHLGQLSQLQLRRLDSYQMPGTESESVILAIQSPPVGRRA